ncbi:hypothetical protein DL768_008766 [Monosporascus sp. mg162]|nr:hypothetical protein DL768_008766 [Monosporascus sp. mg162]
MVLRITSWNVNGIRNPFGYQPWRENRTFEGMFDILEADIVVMQETKIQRYAGVAIYTKNSVCAPIRAEEGITGVLTPPNSSTSFRDLPSDQQIGGYPKPGQLAGTVDEVALDSEGRCVILEFPAFVLIGTYAPANSDGTRDDYKTGYFDALDIRIRNLVAMGKRVVLTGDLNVVRDPIDTANIAERLRKEGMTVEDFFSTPTRRLFNQLVFGGNVQGERDKGREKPVLWDLGRLFHPTRQGMFTCWDTKKNCRPGNFGSRIDYVLCSDSMKDWFVDSNIQEGLMGSDHCPVFATISDIVKIDGKEVHIKDIMNPEGMFRDGNRLRDWTAKDLLPMSAKLIPEFDRRQSIKDMFFKKPAMVPKPSAALAKEPSPNEKQQSETTPIPTRDSSESPLPQPEPLASAPSPRKPSNTGLKRTPSTTSSTSRPQKKTKGTLSREPSGKGQSSLKGFFAPKTTSSPGKKADTEDQGTSLDELNSTPEGAALAEATEGMSYQLDAGTPKDASTPTGTEKIIDPIQSKESWSKLLGKRVLPKCEHGEDCISLVTKKAGANRGELFR